MTGPRPPAYPSTGPGHWELLGSVGVDSAHIGISDPVFVHDGESMPDWGTGIQFMAGLGDGTYDIWGWLIEIEPGDTRIAQIVMTLIDADELKDWFDNE